MARPTAPNLPTGTVTFLFSDIEGSTRLVNALGPRYGGVLERHQSLLRAAFTAEGGVEVATEGDSFFMVFDSAPAAVKAAAAAQRALAAESWPPDVGSVRVRMGLHTGEGTLGGDNYVGLDVHRAARISAAGHGGQVLLSDATRALVGEGLPPEVSLRDVGEHRLKDLDRPERLAQLVIAGLPADFPPLRTLEAPTNLPVELTSFVGRQRETEEIASLVRRSRLVTLLGPGGTGKTRLGMRVARLLRPEFPGGTFFVDLSPIVDPELVPATIAQCLGIREEGSRPVIDLVEAHLRDRRLLLVLDNFEQVIASAPVVGRLLRAAAGVSIVVTSREILRLPGEQEFSVPTLDAPDPDRLPSPEQLVEFDAIALFVERARSVRPGFSVDAGNAAAIAAICARLDGLPLAIELAAARVKLFAPDAILSRLEHRLALLRSTSVDLPERQRTLRGAIDWSHELLDSSERVLFRRLTVFSGGFSIDEAQTVCDSDGELGVDMLDALASLVDKSLVRQDPGERGEPRFRLLETIREYGLDRLDEAAETAAIRERHEACFASLAQRAEPELRGQRQREWLDRLEAERDNLRAAMQHAADGGRPEVAMAMGASLWRYWQQRGHLAEGRAALDSLLALPVAAARTHARAAALAALGGVAYWQGDVPAADRAYAEELAIARERGDSGDLAEALYNAGYVAGVKGDLAAAQRDYEESLRIYESLGDGAGLLNVREALVFLMLRTGEIDVGLALENVSALREIGQPFRLANGLNLLSAVQLRVGDFAGARTSHAESVEIYRAAGDTLGVIRVLLLAAAVAVGSGDLHRAALLCGASDKLREPLGQVATPMSILGLQDPAQAARAGLGDAAFQDAFAAGRALSYDEAVALLRS